VVVVVAADGGGKTPAFVVFRGELLDFTVFQKSKLTDSESQQVICSQPAGWSRQTIGFCVEDEIRKLTNRNTSFLIPQAGFAGR